MFQFPKGHLLHCDNLAFHLRKVNYCEPKDYVNCHIGDSYQLPHQLAVLAKLPFKGL